MQKLLKTYIKQDHFGVLGMQIGWLFRITSQQHYLSLSLFSLSSFSLPSTLFTPSSLSLSSLSSFHSLSPFFPPLFTIFQAFEHGPLIETMSKYAATSVLPLPLLLFLRCPRHDGDCATSHDCSATVFPSFLSDGSKPYRPCERCYRK